MLLVPSRKLSVNHESGTTRGTGADCAFDFDTIHIKITVHNGGEEGGDHDGDDGEDNDRRLIEEDDGYHIGEGCLMEKTMDIGEDTKLYI
nr:hypothetical protein [Tanacetum cinerariifolium]